jgi:C-terminal processing protease CtpA/Prc
MSKHFPRLILAATLIGLMAGAAPLAAQAPDPQVQLKAGFGVTVDRTSQGAPRRGIVIRDVDSDSGAAQAGLQEGDLITQIGRRVVDDYDDLVNAMRHFQTGDALTIQVRRDGVDKSFRIGPQQEPAGRIASAGGESNGTSPIPLGSGEQLQRLLSLLGQPANQPGTTPENSVVQERMFQRLQTQLQQLKLQARNRGGQDQVGVFKGSGTGQDLFAQRLQNRLQQLQRQARTANSPIQYGALKGSAGGQGEFFGRLQSRLEQLKKQARIHDGQRQYGALKESATIEDRIFQRLQTRLQEMKNETSGRARPSQLGAMSKDSTIQDRIYRRLQTRLHQQVRVATANLGTSTKEGVLKGSAAGQGDFFQRLQSRLEQLQKDAPTRDGQPQHAALKGNATVQDRIFRRLQMRLQQMKRETQTGARPNQFGALTKASSQDTFAERLQSRLQQLQKQARLHKLQNQYGSLTGSGTAQEVFSERLRSRLEQLQKQAHHHSGQPQYGAVKADSTIQDRVFERLQKRLQQLAAQSGNPERSDQAFRKPMEMNHQAATPFFGVQVREWMADDAQRKGGAAEEGVIVTAVDPNSPAAAAGIRKGDVIMQVNDKAIINRQDLRQAVQQAGAGQDVSLQVLRGNQPKVILAHLEPDATAANQARLIQQLQNRIQRLEEQLQQQKRD